MAVSAKTFRVFVSSTFDDFVEERNVLQGEVFPELRRRCEARGFRFQPIDLRWGIPLEAGIDQRTMEICLSEIEHCREISPRPNFLVLLGDRYGWRPLPARLSEPEYALISSRIPEPDVGYFASWYPLDENAVPDDADPNEHEHFLAPIEGSPDRDPWDEGRLRKLIDDALERTELQRDPRLVGSATEQEIDRGALSVEDAPEHVFCFFRTIEGIKEDGLPRAGAEAYLDTVPKALASEDPSRLLEDLGARLEDLKDRLEGRLGEGRCYRYRKVWRDGALADDGKQDFATQVQDRLWSVIEAEIEGRTVDDLEVEIKAHELFAEERASHFTGRVAVLDRIASYVASPDGRPLGLWGEPGSGKSAVVAKAVSDAEEVHGGALVIERFVGATAASSDGASLLRDLCREVSGAYGDATEVPSAYRDLVEALPKRLELATVERPLLLFVDAVNQLSDADHARSLAWLPTTLPEHVALVVSTATVPPECRRALEAKLPEDHLLELEPMPVEEAGLVLDLWLRDAHRTLQPPQRDEVLSKFRDEGRPLYLKLAFEEAKLWRSDAPHELHAGIQALVREDLFRRLEDPGAHGPMLVGRALGYIGTGKNGLTEDELLDVLAADEEFWADFVARSQEKHKLPERQLPVSVWSRLYFDLRPYLTERAADGTSLLGFYHLQLAEAVRARYLDGDDDVARHQSLAAYFAGRREKHGLEGNLRVLSELPYQQTMGELWDPLFETLTDFEFLERKATDVGVIVAKDPEGNETRTYTGVYQLEEDFALALREIPGGDGQGADDRLRIIVTATDLGKGLQIRCPHCNRSSDAREEWLGNEIVCPQEGCGGPLRVNTFVVPPDATFRPVDEVVPDRAAVVVPPVEEDRVEEVAVGPDEGSEDQDQGLEPAKPAMETTPGVDMIVADALALHAERADAPLGVHHWIAAALARYGPMAETIVPGLKTRDELESARGSLATGESGSPSGVRVMLELAATHARDRGKTKIAERDLLMAILEAGGRYARELPQR